MTQPDVFSSKNNDDEIDLLQLASNLWRGKFWIAGAAVLALCAGVFFVLRSTPLYQADALIQLEARSSGALALPLGMQDLLGGSGSGSSGIETEIEIIRSRAVLATVVQELSLQNKAHPLPLPFLGKLPGRLHLPEPDLAFLAPYQWTDERIELGELKVPDEWHGKEIILTAAGEGRYQVTLPDGASFSGQLGERLSVGGSGFSLVVTTLEGNPGREFALTQTSLSSAIRGLQRNFSAAAASRQASLMRLTYSDTDPQHAEVVLDAIARAYVAQNIARSAAEVQNSLDFIDAQLPKAKAAVATADQALNAYRQKQRSIDVNFETQNLLERATKTEADLSALALSETELQKQYTPAHPAYQLLLDNRAALEGQLAEIRTEIEALPETQKEIFNLTRSLEVSQQVYLQLMSRAQELQVVRASTVGSVRIVDSAAAAEIPVSPRSMRIYMLSVLIGLMFGAGFVLLRNLMRRGIQGAEEIEKTGLPIFGTLSHSSALVGLRTRKGALPIVALTSPDDVVVEALRSLRTALHFGMLDAKTKAVLLTSAAPEAGKSSTAINLAVVAAQAGQKVCLIDADLRRGYLRRYLELPKTTPGLSELLGQTKTLDEVLMPGPVNGLSVIVTGGYPPNPSELLMRAEFEALLNELNARFDLILIDSPPTLAVTDPVVISRYAGATILVVRHLVTMTGEIEAVKRTFETAGARITGAVLNGYQHSKSGHYGGYQYHYNYRYSYKNGSN